MRIYILTCQALPLLGPDDSKLIVGLQEEGLEPIICIWDQQEVPDNCWVLIRTIWDYTEKEDAFKEMLADFDQRHIKCLNSAETILWNMDKSYIKELHKRGCSVVETGIYYDFNLSQLAAKEVEYPLVIKPLIGASGHDTFLIDHTGQVEMASVLVGRNVIVQPYMTSIIEKGELSFIYFFGEFSHCVLKTAAEGEFRIQAEHGGRVKEYSPSKKELRESAMLLEAVDHEWSYARVDMVEDKGSLRLMELELIEPELFFRFDPGSLKRFCAQLKHFVSNP